MGSGGGFIVFYHLVSELGVFGLQGWAPRAAPGCLGLREPSSVRARSLLEATWKNDGLQKKNAGSPRGQRVSWLRCLAG